jgi:peptidyl-prolyl cis-trans isomerase SurA
MATRMAPVVTFRDREASIRLVRPCLDRPCLDRPCLEAGGPPTMSRTLRPAAFALVTLALGLPGPFARAQEAAQQVDVIDGIAAQVGTEVVLISDVARLSEPLVGRLREQGATDADVAMLRADALERLIDRKLVTLLAKRAEIEATEFEIDEAASGIAQENGMTIDAMRQTIEAQGLSWDAYRARLGEEIVQQKVVSGMVRSRVTVEEKEVEEAYQKRFGSQPTTGEEVHLEHIAVGRRDDKPASLKAACDRVRAGLTRVRAGQDFMEVAREVSDGNPDLGWVHWNALAPWMQEAIGRMQPGQTSDVLELPVGCAVLRLVGRREVQPVSYEEAREKVRAALFEEKFQTEYEAFLERLRKQTYVERKGAFADTGQVSVGSGPTQRQ